MVCFRYIIVNTLYKGDDDDDNNNNNNNLQSSTTNIAVEWLYINPNHILEVRGSNEGPEIDWSD
jgi:hypothetical protein